MNNNPFDPPHIDVMRHASSGVVYTGISQVTRVGMQFLATVIAARLLSPADFGLVAKVMPVYAFALLFQDLGLAQATLQRPNLTRAQVNASFWINVAVAGAITIVLTLASPIVGWFYQDPRTVPLTIAIVALVTLSSVGTLHGAIMARTMAFRAQCVSTVLGAIGSFFATVVSAWIWHSYWAIIAGLAAGTVIPTIVVWYVIDWRPGRPALASDTGSMLRYGLHLTSGNLVNFITQYAGNVLIGRYLGDVNLGIYDRASRLLPSPIQQLIQPINKIVTPILYRLHDDPERYRRTFLRTLIATAMIIMPGIVWVAIASSPVIDLLLGPSWIEAATTFSWLSIAALPQVLNASAATLIVTQGRSGNFATWSYINAVVSVGALLIGLSYGLEGVAVSAVCAEFLRTPILWIFACRTGPVTIQNVARAMLPCFCGGAVSVPVLMFYYVTYQVAHSVIGLIAGAAISYGLVFATLALFPDGRDMLRQNMGFISYTIRRKGARAQAGGASL